MVVQHNMQAINSNRMLSVTTGSQAKSTEKLSSGYKINRAADDAAGLAISEKMRKQIKGLDRASTNAQDGVSAVQTAEGALNEVQSMLQRMNELAVQSANGTNSESDRTAIQNEIDQLTTEIDRVSETTKFNETYLLKGDKAVTKDVRYQYNQWANGATVAASVKFANDGVDTTTGMKLEVSFKASIVSTENKMAAQADQNAVAKAIRDSGLSISETKTWDANAQTSITTFKLQLTGDAAQKYNVVASSVGGAKDSTQGVFYIQTKGGENIAKVTITGTGKGGFNPEATSTDQVHTVTATMSAKEATAAKTTGHGESAEYFDKDGNKISNNALNRYFSVDSGSTETIASTNIKARGDAQRVYDAVGNLTTLNPANIGATRDLTGALNVSLHVGADSSANNKITMNIQSMSSKSLGINGLKVDGSDSTNSDNAIETIKEALQKVSDQRAALGAVQNRLEHTIANLDNVVENTEASESRIRDTDIADEMVTYSKNNILAQAGQSMLAQANQSTQGALSLLG